MGDLFERGGEGWEVFSGRFGRVDESGVDEDSSLIGRLEAGLFIGEAMVLPAALVGVGLLPDWTSVLIDGRFS